MINEPDYSDPAYWESQGIKMIEIDLNDQGSVDTGLKELVERIRDAIEDAQEEEKTNF